MKNLNLEALLALKESIDTGKVIQSKKICETLSTIVSDDFYERMSRLTEIKEYIESRIQGITVEVSGGYKVKDAEEPDGFNYKEIEVKTFKNNDRCAYSLMKFDGFYIGEMNTATLVYENYLQTMIEQSGVIENHTVSIWENVIRDLMVKNYLFDCEYRVEDNEVFLLVDDGIELIIEDIEKEVIGVLEVKTNKNDELGSLVILCNNKNVLITEDGYYVDSSNLKLVL